jgi:hypothetical protein
MSLGASQDVDSVLRMQSKERWSFGLITSPNNGYLEEMSEREMNWASIKTCRRYWKRARRVPSLNDAIESRKSSAQTRRNLILRNKVPA